MQTEPGKRTGILKHNNMDSAAKGHNDSHDAGSNVGNGVTSVTQVITPDWIVHHCFDMDNAPSLNDDELVSNSSTSNSSFLEIVVWQKKPKKTSPGSESWKILNAQASVQSPSANFGAGSLAPTAITRHLGGGVTGSTACVVRCMCWWNQSLPSIQSG